jgi:membrane protease YdiL (CAAX protease family)
MIETEKPLLPNQPHRLRQGLELGVFLFLIVPSLALQYFVGVENIGFVTTAIATILRDLALVSLIFYFTWVASESPAVLGLAPGNPWREILLGILLFIPFFYLFALLENFLLTHGLHGPQGKLPDFALGKGIGPSILATFMVIVVAFAEELIFRGYLMLRIGNITGSRFWSVILSAAVFTLGHGYEGSAGLLTVGLAGIAFALIYLWRGNLVAVMTMHFLQDFISIVLAAVLSTN